MLDAVQSVKKTVVTGSVYGLLLAFFGHQASHEASSAQDMMAIGRANLLEPAIIDHHDSELAEIAM